jgi:hypothetical protein
MGRPYRQGLVRDTKRSCHLVLAVAVVGWRIPVIGWPLLRRRCRWRRPLLDIPWWSGRRRTRTRWWTFVGGGGGGWGCVLSVIGRGSVEGGRRRLCQWWLGGRRRGLGHEDQQADGHESRQETAHCLSNSLWLSSLLAVSCEKRTQVYIHGWSRIAARVKHVDGRSSK